MGADLYAELLSVECEIDEIGEEIYEHRLPKRHNLWALRTQLESKAAAIRAALRDGGKSDG